LDLSLDESEDRGRMQRRSEKLMGWASRFTAPP
jgi:hypothetical protein